jgi:hypothetical protein
VCAERRGVRSSGVQECSMEQGSGCLGGGCGWACRKGYDFARRFMAAPVLAAAKALGLHLALQLHITGGRGEGC